MSTGSVSDDAYPDAEVKEVDSYLRDEADAASVGALYLAYLNRTRIPMQFTIYNKGLGVNIMDSVKITKNRYAIDDYYRVLGIEANLGNGSTRLTVA